MDRTEVVSKLKELLATKPTEPILIAETDTAYEGETLRFVYVPEVESFVMGPNAGPGKDDDEVIFPSYLRNIQEINRYIYEDEDAWLNYVSSLWLTHSLNAFFVKELDPSYHFSSIIQRALRSDEDLTSITDLPAGHRLVFMREAQKAAVIDSLGKVIAELALREGSDEVSNIMQILKFWDENEGSLLAKMESEKESSVEEEEFDLDNLYDGLDGNSSNPIDASQPEIQEEDTSCPGGACKL